MPQQLVFSLSLYLMCSYKYCESIWELRRGVAGDWCHWIPFLSVNRQCPGIRFNEGEVQARLRMEKSVLAFLISCISFAQRLPSEAPEEELNPASGALGSLQAASCYRCTAEGLR